MVDPGSSNSAKSARPARLPLGVVIPTCNHSAQIPAHLSSLDRWLDLTEEVVVVDAASADGTLDLLRAGLLHRRLQFLERPAGLVAAINFAVTQLATEFVYLSPPGEAITRDGLVHLVEMARRLGCDLLLSPPVREENPPRNEVVPRCPAESIVAAGLTEPRTLRPSAAFYAALDAALRRRPQSLLGGLAGVVFRTAVLRARPLPADRGTAAPLFWGLQHGLYVSIAIAPRRCATIGAPNLADSCTDGVRVSPGQTELIRVAAHALDAALGDATRADHQELRALRRYLDAAGSLVGARRLLNELRRRDLVWFLRPAVWRARSEAARARGRWREANAELRTRPWFQPG